ncbi:hypothetical protein INR49_011322 [Caranx melampygus]|nr:hypothetical protein INR49_011322 [Caranx melampygus]
MAFVVSSLSLVILPANYVHPEGGSNSRSSSIRSTVPLGKRVRSQRPSAFTGPQAQSRLMLNDDHQAGLKLGAHRFYNT